MEYSLRLYRETRQRFRAEMLQRLDGRSSRVAIYGTGEAAELAYLCLKELGVEPVAVFDGDSAERFLGMPVVDVRRHADVSYDLIVVATMAAPAPFVAKLAARGIPLDRLVLLRRLERTEA